MQFLAQENPPKYGKVNGRKSVRTPVAFALTSGGTDQHQRSECTSRFTRRFAALSSTRVCEKLYKFVLMVENIEYKFKNKYINILFM